MTVEFTWSSAEIIDDGFGKWKYFIWFYFAWEINEFVFDNDNKSNTETL